MSNKPRQPLTKKRRGAIEAYVLEKTYKHPALRFQVDAVLKAEKMDAQELYEWLKAKGWLWQYGQWGKKVKPIGKQPIRKQKREDIG